MDRWKSLLKEIWSESLDDNITGESAKTAYYFFLSLFPVVLVIFALTGIIGGDAAFQTIMGRVRSATPAEAGRIIGRAIHQITNSRRPGVLSLGLVLAIWSGSNIFAALTDGLNKMYDVKETRSWWKKRLIALGLLVAAVVLLVGGSTLILSGRSIGTALGIASLWDAIRYPLAFAMVVLLMWLAYYFLPDRDQNHVKTETFIGALVGTTLWILASVAFRAYVAHFGSYSATYGIVGAVIVLMLWLFITAVTLLLGGEVAAVLEARQQRRNEEPQKSTRPPSAQPALNQGG